MLKLDLQAKYSFLIRELISNLKKLNLKFIIIQLSRLLIILLKIKMDQNPNLANMSIPVINLEERKIFIINPDKAPLKKYFNKINLRLI